jgi:hypothetical protein
MTLENIQGKTIKSFISITGVVIGKLEAIETHAEVISQDAHGRYSLMMRMRSIHVPFLCIFLSRIDMGKLCIR